MFTFSPIVTPISTTTKFRKFIMKKFGNYLLMFFMASALLVTSCSKDDDGKGDGPTPPQGEGLLSAKIDGVDFVATNEVMAYQGEFEDTQVLMVAGEDGEERLLWITIQDFTGQTGTYTIDDDTVGVLYWEQRNQMGWWAEPGGTITITNFSTNGRVKGTFQFELNNLNEMERTVTDGKFDLRVVHEID